MIVFIKSIRGAGMHVCIIVLTGDSVNFPECVNYGHVCMLPVSMSHLGG